MNVLVCPSGHILNSIHSVRITRKNSWLTCWAVSVLKWNHELLIKVLCLWCVRISEHRPVPACPGIPWRPAPGLSSKRFKSPRGVRGLLSRAWVWLEYHYKSHNIITRRISFIVWPRLQRKLVEKLFDEFLYFIHQAIDYHKYTK